MSSVERYKMKTENRTKKNDEYRVVKTNIMFFLVSHAHALCITEHSQYNIYK